MKNITTMKRYLTWVFSLLVCLSTYNVWGQNTSNTVKFQVTYDVQTQMYTAWVVPDYSTPNNNNTGVNELVSTAQVTLKVPISFVISNITDASGTQSWEKNPVKLGKGLSLTTSSGSSFTQTYGNNVDPNFAYYVIGKAPNESNLGRFTANTPVALFTFKGNGCFGPVSPIPNNDPFLVDPNASVYAVGNNFFSASGQPVGGNQMAVEQFIDIIGSPADCRLPIQAISDINITNVNTPVSGNVVTNDINPQGTTLTVSLLNPPPGSLTLTPSGSYTYTPPTDFTGTVSFCYSISNTVGQSSTACVSINVLPLPTPGNDPPVANNDASRTESGKPVVIVVLANDSDPDDPSTPEGRLGNPIIISQPSAGTAIVNNDGTVTYTPPAGLTGVVTFPYRVCDSVLPTPLCSTALVTVIVQPTSATGTTQSPIAVDDAILTSVNTSKTATVAGNDSDPNTPALSLTFTSGQPSHGSVVFSSTGSYTYTPTTGYVGTDSFTYTACNTAGLCSKATVYIDVQGLTLQSPVAKNDI
ncbi:Ig-like domain-containing protein, partial [Arsenicibacter rosenii]|uniref:Ig-like domain-containing protein n=1 Tax=Arsenicibacter rosenii TaxID=1750698 RepID=UPI000A8B5F67